MKLTDIQLGIPTAPGSPFTVNRFVNAAGFKLVLNGTGTNIFELTTGAAGATRRFAFASSGQLTMDAYGVGTFVGIATKWLAVTAAGLVIEENPPTGATITADNALTMSTATNVQLGSSTATGSPLLHHTFIYGNNAFTLNMNDVRFETDKGANVVAANDLTVGLDGNVFTLTGNTQINAITNANWQGGSFLIFEMTGTPLFKHNTAGGAGTLPMKLAGNTDYQAAADDAILFYNNGSFWHELARKQAAQGGRYTFQNALTEIAGNKVEWGGTLLHGTTVNTAGFITTFTGSNVNEILKVQNTATSSGAYAISGLAAANVAAVSGTNTGTGAGLQGIATSGTGVVGASTTGLGGAFSVNPSSTSIVVNVIELTRNTTGTAANGMGGRIQGTLENSAGTRLGMAIDWVWTVVTDATRTTDVRISTVNAGTTSESVRFTGPGTMRLRNITSTAASALTAADGDVVYVTDTDATFTAVGFWGREAGVWIKL